MVKVVVKRYTFWVLLLSVPFVSLIAISMDSASDRLNYMRFFSDPYVRTRFEPGFVLIGRILSIFLTPETSIVAISLLTFILLALSWRRIYTGNALLSLLSFHLSAYFFFNYFLGTAIRNGLASALSVYIFTIAVTQRGFYGKLLILFTPLFHFAASLFSGLASAFMFFGAKRKSMYIVMSLASFSIFIFLYILPSFISSAYYLAYLEAGAFGTGRFRSFSMLLYSVLLILIVMRNGKDHWALIAFVPLPILVFYLITGLDAFHRLMMPFFFIATAVFFSNYERFFLRNFHYFIYVYLLALGNVLGVIYAASQWRIL